MIYPLRLVAVLCVLCAVLPVRADTGDHFDAARSDMRAMMNRVSAHFSLPSLSVAVAVDGTIVFAEATGFADVEAGMPATPATLYSVGSIAKPMTAVTLARLVDQGQLNLDDPVVRHVPEVAVLNAAFTVRQLASHMAGIGRPLAARNVLEFNDVRDRTSPFEVLSLVTDHPLEAAPGAAFQYTSAGYILLSAVIERAAGKPYLNVMQDEVFTPLGMTGVAFDTATAGAGLEARYYTHKEPGGGYVPATVRRDRSFLFGGGGYIATPSDLVRLTGAFAKDGYLSADMREALQTPVRLDSGAVNEEAYALGWRTGPMRTIAEDGEPLAVVHHGGVTADAANAFVVYVPEHRVALAFATNMVPPKFWQIRGAMGRAVMAFIDATEPG